MTQQPSLLDFPPVKRSRDRLVMPAGFRHQDDLIDAAEERDLVRRVEALPFKPFEFQGYVGNRRVASFGWRYDFAREMLEPAAPMPDFLRALRLRIATFTGHDPETLQQALVLEYTPGAGIGGIATGRNIGMSSACLCCRPARSGCDARPTGAGSGRRSGLRRAQPICSADRPARTGSTRSRRWKRCAIR